MSLQSILPALTSRPITQGSDGTKLLALGELISYNFSLSTCLLVGASLQSLLAFFVPSKSYALLPAILILAFRIFDAILVHCNLKPNPYMQKVLLGKATAVIPRADNGEIVAPASGQEKVAVCLLGAKSNHPFGFFAPEFLKTSKWAMEINTMFDTQGSAPNGFLGQTNWSRKDERGGCELMFLSYWRSIEDLHAFAHAPLHREAWKWWEKTVKEHNFIGISHEIYEAERGHWENVFINFQPTGLGATTYVKRSDGKVAGGDVPNEWISPLVDARRGKMSSSAGRLGRGVTKFDEGRPTGDVYLA